MNLLLSDEKLFSKLLTFMQNSSNFLDQREQVSTYQQLMHLCRQEGGEKPLNSVIMSMEIAFKKLNHDQLNGFMNELEKKDGQNLSKELEKIMQNLEAKLNQQNEKQPMQYQNQYEHNPENCIKENCLKCDKLNNKNNKENCIKENCLKCDQQK